MLSNKTPAQLLQCLFKLNGVPDFWKRGLGKHIILAPGAVAKDDRNSLFKCCFSHFRNQRTARPKLLRTHGQLLWLPGPGPQLLELSGEPLEGLKGFSTGDEPVSILRICWITTTLNLPIIPDITGGFICQCTNTINVKQLFARHISIFLTCCIPIRGKSNLKPWWSMFCLYWQALYHTTITK